MYHPSVIAARQEALLRQPSFRAMYPTGFPDYSPSDTRALTSSILQTRDPSTKAVIRALTPEESRFAAAAKLRIMFDAPYFLENFVYIDMEGHGLRPLYPLWKSQQFVLDRIAAIEYRKWQAREVDGILLNVLKVDRKSVV